MKPPVHHALPALCVLLVASVPAIAVPAIAQKPDAPAPVEVARVVEAETHVGQRVVGTVQPLRVSTIGSAVDGRVLEFEANHGDPVKKGQRLAQLRTETFEIQIAAARAGLNLAKHQLAELANGSLPEEIAEAEARMNGARAARDAAASRVQRLVTLSEAAATSEAEMEDAKELADSAFYSLMASEAMLKRIKDGPRVESIAQAEARVELQTQNVNLLEDQLKKLSIVSPFDGFVAAEFTEVGAWISRGDPIAQVVQLNEVEIQVPATAEHAVHIRRGDSMRVEFPELPDEIFLGTVDRIVPVAESRARTFPVYVRMKNKFDDEKPMLLAGMLARVELPAARRQVMPLVPKDALVLNQSDRSVFVVDENNVVRRVNVQLGLAVKDLVQVRGDLKEGDLVVITGNERLQPGKKVRIVRTIELNDPNESRNQD